MHVATLAGTWVGNRVFVLLVEAGLVVAGLLFAFGL